MDVSSAYFGMNLTALLVVFILAVVLFVSISGFIKINIAINLLKNALGTQQVPSNLVVNIMSASIAVLAIWPVAEPCFHRLMELADTENVLLAEQVFKQYEYIFSELIQHVLAKVGDSGVFEVSDNLLKNIALGTLVDVIQGVEVGMRFYLVFLAIDIVISLILSASGMTSLSPTIISVPLKLAVFYYGNGWEVLLEALQ